MHQPLVGSVPLGMLTGIMEKQLLVYSDQAYLYGQNVAYKIKGTLEITA